MSSLHIPSLSCLLSFLCHPYMPSFFVIHRIFFTCLIFIHGSHGNDYVPKAIIVGGCHGNDCIQCVPRFTSVCAILSKLQE